MEDWGKDIFPEGGGIKFRKWATPPPDIPSAPIPLYPSSIQDGSNENPINYLAFRSKIMPALQAKKIIAKFSHVTKAKVWLIRAL